MTSLDHVEDLLLQQTNGKFVPKAEKGGTSGGIRNDPDLVSVICPTGTDRQSFHPFLYRCFCRQTHVPCELIVVDVGGSASATSKFFTVGPAAADPRVIYRFFSVAETEKPWSIGTKRNIACYLSSGEIIVHFDDDDIYMAEYVEWMLQVLRWGSVRCNTPVSLHSKKDASGFSCLKWPNFAAGAATLSRWWTHELSTSLFFICNPQSEESQVARHSAIFGYGFSYAYLREFWCMNPFQDVDLGEDILFMETLLDKGWQVALICDKVGFCAHAIHESNISGVERSLLTDMFPPSGLRESSVVLRRLRSNSNWAQYQVDRHVQSSIRIKEEIISIFATGEFQTKIREAAESASSPQKKAGAVKMLCMEQQLPIYPKYGFEGSMKGMLQARTGWPPWVSFDPEVAMKDMLMLWLIDIELQASNPLQQWIPGLKDKSKEDDNLEVLVAKAMKQIEDLTLRARGGPIPSLVAPEVAENFNAPTDRQRSHALKAVTDTLVSIGYLPMFAKDEKAMERISKTQVNQLWLQFENSGIASLSADWQHAIRTLVKPPLKER